MFSLYMMAWYLGTEAATYYFDSNMGDDSRTATEAQSQDMPWKSLSKFNLAQSQY